VWKTEYDAKQEVYDETLLPVVATTWDASLRTGELEYSNI
jgi:hypothetical protein